MTLIDNGSAINVCPLKTARKLGVLQEEFKASNHAIRAYDNTKRDTMGVLWLNITSGPIEKRVKFHVMDIKTSFNLLLGRPWLHELGAVPSTLHQKIKLPLGDTVVTIDASPMKMQVSDQPIINIDHDDNDEELWGFSVSTIEAGDVSPFEFDPYSNLVVNAVLRKQGYFPGLSLEGTPLSLPKPQV